ncbi:MAG: prepilin-type N-terminal cleavage/methylation domain-containing protein [Desulfobacterales bacterium]|nr:prepilin-type N-terminal cleavage/methylation domain-containing protein [Desulfobacterales bacterium]
MLKNRKEQGFTLYELMIVIAVIGIIAAIAIPNFLKYRARSYEAAAKSDAKNAYTAAQVFFSSDPSNIDLTDQNQLEEYGYCQSPDIVLNVSGAIDTLLITIKHAAADKTYSVNSNGDIS